MDFFDDLGRLASADQEVRRNELLALLREMDCPFLLWRSYQADARPENIVVRFQEGASPRLVIGAHYDSVPGSTGANDNGAGVCILLAWLRKALHHPPAIPVDVVFFDLEEIGRIGSRAYLERIPPKELVGMINLDICGVGDTILVAPSSAEEQYPFNQPLLNVRQANLSPYRLVDALPPGDDLSFAHAGVPALSVCILPAEDVEPLIEVATALRQGRYPARPPRIMETFHNGPRDSIGTVEAAAMEKVLQWLESILQQWS